MGNEIDGSKVLAVSEVAGSQGSQGYHLGFLSPCEVLTGSAPLFSDL